jgi:cation:H+ antiporter
MDPVFSAWLALIACAAVIVAAGPALSRYGDVIADRAGISSSWIGLILLGTVVDFLYREAPVYTRAHQGHILSAGFGVVLIGFVGMNLLIADQAALYAFGHIGIYTPIIVGLYLLAARTVFVYERDHREAYVEGAAERYPGVTLRSAVARFAVASIFIVAAGIWLPFIGSDLAAVMGWQTTFVGSLFVAGATSLPELVVTLAAVRFGAVNLAIANLLGSNLFDILILAIDDLFYLDGPILSDVSPAHAVSAGSAVVMSGLVIVSLLYRPRRRLFFIVGWTSLGLFVLYLVNTYVLFLLDG